MKKMIFIIALLILLTPNFNSSAVCFAVNNESENEDEIKLLSNEIDLQLENLDLSELELSYFNSIFGKESDVSFKDFLKEVINGNVVIDFGFVLDYIKLEINNNIATYLSLFITIILIGVLSLVCGEMFSKKTDNTISHSISNIFYYVVSIMIIGLVIIILKDTVNIVQDMSNATQIVFPILLSLLITIGANSTAVFIQPSISFLITFFINFISTFLLPIVIVGFVCKLLNNMTDEVKLDKFTKFIGSIFKWSIGFMFTIFVGILSLQGLTSSSVDNISIKTAKYAIRNYVPMVGGYFSDSFEIFRAGSVLIKNGLGVICALVIFSIALMFVVKIMIMNLGFKFASGVLEPMGSTKISKMLENVSELFIQLLTIVLSVFFMTFVLLLVLISAGNLAI